MQYIKQEIETKTAFAPATVSNLAVGFDILGFPIDGIGDKVHLTRRDDKRIIIDEIISDADIPKIVEKNTATVALQYAQHELKLDCGFNVKIEKGIPLGSGMGGSAASAVAAIVALNGFLEQPLSNHEVAEYALKGEAISSGTMHGDNVLPCVFGGLVLIRDINPVSICQLPNPDIYCVLIHPHITVETRKAREMLKPELPLHDFVKQSANLATFMVALYENKPGLMRECLQDVLIEPYRSKLVKGFDVVKRAALDAGALGCSLSGSGPSMFAFAHDKEAANKISDVMQTCFAEQGVKADSHISEISQRGARLL